MDDSTLIRIFCFKALNTMLGQWRAKVKMTTFTNVKFHQKVTNKHMGVIVQPRRALSKSTGKVIAIGASTGGTQGIRQRVSQFPASAPSIIF